FGSLLRNQSDSQIAFIITHNCLQEEEETFRHEWNYKTAALYGFGILTTLGYGKIEPRTRNGRIFAVIYGFFGIPLTVILLTNLGRYLERIAIRCKHFCMRYRGSIIDEVDGMGGTTLLCLIVIYLITGAILIPLLEGQFDFFNGIYFAFICLTAIEYGDLVPSNNWYIPIVIIYVSLGLGISTICLDLGSIYVRKLHYLGQKIRNIANIRIWFGSRDLRVHELVNAVGHNIGLQENIINDIDLDYLVHVAIQVKEGRLLQIPQTHIVEGIWPPELVPLFIKEGNFPEYVDSDEKLDIRNDEELKTPPPIPLQKRRNTVRFEDEEENKEKERKEKISIERVYEISSSPPLEEEIEREEDGDETNSLLSHSSLIQAPSPPVMMNNSRLSSASVSFADESSISSHISPS
ncbi:twk-29, partial [Pristionchus pacificus]|uniref:Twk-29 n=1 Tax=Pristionchus pacificus TaxID=54126 RepID=A0A2A6CGT0_PRIPA